MEGLLENVVWESYISKLLKTRLNSNYNYYIKVLFTN
jgi:5-methylcytosine-specific restriction endonuclease McrBC regulatory subunit McrC